MSQICQEANPELFQTLANPFADPERIQAAQEGRAYSVSLNLTGKCFGSCAYCYACSTSEVGEDLERERGMRLIEEMREIGVRLVTLNQVQSLPRTRSGGRLWHGGDPILNPHWYDFLTYAAELGLRNMILLSGLLSKKTAGQLCRLRNEGRLESVVIHIDSIDPEVYARVHTDPQTLEKKVRGYRLLLDAGFPPAEVSGCITLTRPVLQSLEKTVDWYVDEMGAKSLCFATFKPEGFARKDLKEWEPGKSELRRAYEYRARRLGPEWLRIGSSDFGKYLCRTYFGILWGGRVVPCLCLSELEVGNIYQESLVEIFHRRWEALLFDFPVQGPCGNCQNSDVCFGCRTHAYLYTGDLRGSDPKCYLNPQAPEYCFE